SGWPAGMVALSRSIADRRGGTTMPSGPPIIPLIIGLLAASPGDDPARVERERHQGTWAVVSFEREGKATPKETLDEIKRVVRGDQVVWTRDGEAFAETTVALDPSKAPKAIDVTPTSGPSKGKVAPGIYKLDADTLTICMAAPGKERPSSFKAEKGSG